jgi:hypothetical protein
MRAHSFTGSLVPGVNLDSLDIEAGMRELVAAGYPATEGERHMVIHYALQRWARGEEHAAERGAIDQSFYGIDLTSWRRVLARAMAAAQPGLQTQD